MGKVFKPEAVAAFKFLLSYCFYLIFSFFTGLYFKLCCYNAAP